MSTTQANETYTQNFVRAFTQRGGPSPSNLVRYAGLDEQYLMVGDIARPDRGNVNAINVNDPRVRGLFKRTGITIDAPDIPSNSLTFKQFINGVPWYQFRLNCPINVYESFGPCADPSDPLNGWITLTTLSRGLSSDKTYAGRTPFDGSDETTAEIKFSWLGDVYTIGGIAIGEQASVAVTTEVVDIIYYGPARCSDCGPTNDGTKWIAALQQTAGGSSAVNGVVKYSTDYGQTWTDSAITGLAIGSLVTAIKQVGQYLVVLSSTELAYYVSQFDQLTGVPGAWVKVSTGFVAAKNPNDMWVESPNAVYFVGNGGYIYKSTNILTGVTVLSAAGQTTQNLNRIHGAAGTIVVVGAGNQILISTNRGATWSTPAAGVTGAHSAISVLGPLEWYLGTLDTTGKVWYTESAGAIWTQQVLPGAALTSVNDIVAATNEDIWISATRSGPTATIFQTTYGGAIWGESNTSRLPPTLPVFARANRIAVPQVPDLMISANNIALAGLGGSFTDGVIYIGSAPVF